MITKVEKSVFSLNFFRFHLVQKMRAVESTWEIGILSYIPQTFSSNGMICGILFLTNRINLSRKSISPTYSRVLVMIITSHKFHISISKCYYHQKQQKFWETNCELWIEYDIWNEQPLWNKKAYFSLVENLWKTMKSGPFEHVIKIFPSSPKTNWYFRHHYLFWNPYPLGIRMYHNLKEIK